MKKLSITVHGDALATALTPVAHQYAMLSIKRVVTVRHAPKFGPEDERRWRAMRDTLLSIVPELPEVGEPVWPERYLHTDWVVTKSHTLDAGGIKFNVVDKSELRKGAKKRPTYDDDRTLQHTRTWRDNFMKMISELPEQ